VAGNPEGLPYRVARAGAHNAGCKTALGEGGQGRQECRLLTGMSAPQREPAPRRRRGKGQKPTTGRTAGVARRTACSTRTSGVARKTASSTGGGRGWVEERQWVRGTQAGRNAGRRPGGLPHKRRLPQKKSLPHKSGRRQECLPYRRACPTRRGRRQECLPCTGCHSKPGSWRINSERQILYDQGET